MKIMSKSKSLSPLDALLAIQILWITKYYSLTHYCIRVQKGYFFVLCTYISGADPGEPHPARGPPP
jgi:hypothetical protein